MPTDHMPAVEAVIRDILTNRDSDPLRVEPYETPWAFTGAYTGSWFVRVIPAAHEVFVISAGENQYGHAPRVDGPDGKPVEADMIGYPKTGGGTELIAVDLDAVNSPEWRAEVEAAIDRQLASVRATQAATVGAAS